MRSLVNGSDAHSLDISDRGLQYGDGLFETLAVENGVIKNWELHWARLSLGCERLFIPQPNELQILSEIEHLLTGIGKELVKIMLTRGSGTRGYAFKNVTPSRVVSVYEWPEMDPQKNIDGVELYLCETRLAKQPLLAGIKHLNRLENVLARHEWQSPQYAEGILRDTDDFVIEGSMSNVFLVSAGKLQTPLLSHSGVNGITRQRIMALAREEGIAVQETEITLQQLYDAEEIFVCNSIIGIWPVRKIGEHYFATEQKTENEFRNPITRLMQAKLI